MAVVRRRESHLTEQNGAPSLPGYCRSPKDVKAASFEVRRAVATVRGLRCGGVPPAAGVAS